MLNEMHGEIIETKITFKLWHADKIIHVDVPLVTRELIESTDSQVGKCIKECIRLSAEYSRAKKVRIQTRR